MLRTRVLRPRGLAVALVLWAAAWLALPAPVEGAPLPPRAGGAVGPAADGTAAAVEERAVRLVLAAQGLTPRDVDAVVARLSPDERAELAARAPEVGAGGNGFLLVIILVLVASILLYLPMAGRTEGWWQ